MSTTDEVKELSPAQVAARDLQQRNANRAAPLSRIMESYSIQPPNPHLPTDNFGRTWVHYLFAGRRFGEQVAEVEMVAGGWDGRYLDGWSIRVVTPTVGNADGDTFVMVGYVTAETVVEVPVLDPYGRQQYDADGRPLVEPKLGRNGQPVLNREWAVFLSGAQTLEDAQELARLLADDFVAVFEAEEFRLATADERSERPADSDIVVSTRDLV